MYKFVFKRKFFRRFMSVIGHRFDSDQNKMIIYFPDGAVREIKKWTDCECFLGADWVNHVKNEMEKETGANIKLQTD